MSRFLALAIVVAACHHDTAVKTTPVEPVAAPPAVAQQSAPPTTASQPVSPNLDAGAGLIAMCKLHAASEQQAAPKFAFNESDLTAQDRDVLQQIATCVTKGPAR